MKRTSWIAALGMAAVLAAAPCDAQSARGGELPSNRNRIGRTEVENAHASSVYNLVRARRPAWLNRQHAASFTSSPELLVFVDGARLDGVNELRQIATLGVETVEFLTAAQAEFRFGQSSPNGAIVVTMQGSAPPAQRDTTAP